MRTTVTLSQGRAVAPIGPMLWQQVKAELLKLARTPGFSISSLALPMVLFAFFGLRDSAAMRGGVEVGQYVLASFAAYGVMSVMLYSFGVSVAAERGQRIHLLARATPLRPAVALTARVITALIFALAMLLLLFAFAALVGGVQSNVGTLLRLAGSLLLGALPFVALGFGIGYLVSPTSAAPITNLSFVVLSFLSGIFVPLTSLPDYVQQIAPYLPTYRVAQLAWLASGARADPLTTDLVWLVVFGVAFSLFALCAYRIGERRMAG
jgi:ABC-2 type transport system permease protein